MSVYNWTGRQALPANDNTTVAGLANNQGMASLQGVHTSDLAYGLTNAGIEGARLQPESYYSGIFLERKRLKGEDLVFAGYAESRTIPTGNSQITLKKYQPLRAHIVPLVEGRKPAPDFAGGKAIVAKTRAYGRYMEFTDQFDIKVADPVMEEYTNELGDVAAETIDLLAQAALLAEAQVFFPVLSGAVAKVDLANKFIAAATADKKNFRPTLSDLRLISLHLRAAKVATIGGKYHVLASPAVMYDLQTELFELDNAAFGTQSAYAGGMPDIFELTFKTAMSSRVETVKSTGATPTDVTVHHTIILGAKAFSKIEIAGNGNVQFFTKGLGSAGTLDPINQRQTVGWKINALGFKVTDPDAVIDYMTVPSQAEVTVGGFDYVSGDDLTKYGATTEMIGRVELMDGITLTKEVSKDNNLIGGINSIKADNAGVISKVELDKQFEGIDAKDALVTPNADGKTNSKDHSRIKKA